MNIQSPYKISDINLDSISFKNIKESENRKIIFIKYKDDNFKNMVFQLPTLFNNITCENNEIDISINCNDEHKTKKVLDFFNKVDSKIIEEAKHNSNIWFDHITDKTKINYNHTLQVKDNDENVIRLKIINSKEFNTKLILNNDDDDKVLFKNIPTTGNLKLVLECYAIWVHDNSFGIIYRPVIISFICSEYNYKILDDSESDDNNYELFIKPKDNINDLNDINNVNDSLISSSDLDENNLNKLIFNCAKFN